MKRETVGFMVIQDDQQGMIIPLGLDITADYDDQQLPELGVLGWETPFVFLSRKEARAAITRTHHYAKAFDRDDLPLKEFCRIVKVQRARPS